MRRLVTTMATIISCDACGNRSTCLTCKGCKADICVTCAEETATGYPSSWGVDCKTVYYCLACDAKLVDDPVHAAYVALRDCITRWRELSHVFKSELCEAKTRLQVALDGEGKDT